MNNTNSNNLFLTLSKDLIIAAFPRISNFSISTIFSLVSSLNGLVSGLALNMRLKVNSGS